MVKNLSKVSGKKLVVNEGYMGFCIKYSVLIVLRKDLVFTVVSSVKQSQKSLGLIGSPGFLSRRGSTDVPDCLFY